MRYSFFGHGYSLEERKCQKAVIDTIALADRHIHTIQALVMK